MYKRKVDEVDISSIPLDFSSEKEEILLNLTLNEFNINNEEEEIEVDLMSNTSEHFFVSNVEV